VATCYAPTSREFLERAGPTLAGLRIAIFPPEYLIDPTAWKSGFCEVHMVPIDSLSLFSDSAATVCLFVARRSAQQSNSSFAESRKNARQYIRGHLSSARSLAHCAEGGQRSSLIHRSAWNHRAARLSRTLTRRAVCSRTHDGVPLDRGRAYLHPATS
jgi:hypothetical protein